MTTAAIPDQRRPARSAPRTKSFLVIVAHLSRGLAHTNRVVVFAGFEFHAKEDRRTDQAEYKQDDESEDAPDGPVIHFLIPLL